MVYGDNTPYADYIKAHNHATDTSVEWVKRLIPLAEKTKVVIALENVSNNLWVTPEIFRHFVAIVPEPVGQGVLRHRQSRALRPA